MNISIENLLSLYCDNCMLLKKPLYWKASSYHVKQCALIYAFENTKADPLSLIEAINAIKKETHLFSCLRNSRVTLAAQLTAKKRNIESEFPRLSQCYDILRKAGFRSSSLLAIAATALFSISPRGHEQRIAEAAKLIYDSMKKHHRFLTSSDDYASAIILASCNLPADQMMEEIETTYKLLKNSGFHSSSGLQFLSHMLFLDPAPPEEKAARCKSIIKILKENKNRVSSMFYGIAGFLAITGEQWENAVYDTLKAVDYIKERKCGKGGGREFNLMMASALVCKSYLSENSSNKLELLRIGVGVAIEAVIAAQIAACAAASAAVAAASSSSN
jgi:hypothetical protein